MTIYTGEALYTCIYCTKSFNNNGNMYKHLRERHTERWNRDRARKNAESNDVEAEELTN